MFGSFGFDMGFSPFNILFYLVFALVLGVFVFVLVRGVRQWRKNNRSPRLTVDARVVARRVETNVSQMPVGGDITGAQGYTTSSSATYFVTFEVESGDRMELHVPKSEYVYIAEGDIGRLTFQGTRFLGFERA